MTDTITNAEKEFPVDLLQKVYGFQISQVIFCAVDLGIFDLLETCADKQCSAHEVSRQLNLAERCTHRLMTMCATLELMTLVKDANGLDSFRNTSRTSRFLVRSSPTSMVGFINGMSPLYSSCMLMKTVVEKGQKAVVDENIAGSGQISEVKMEYNKCMMKLAAPALVNVFDLRSFTAMYDLAGGVGTFARVMKQTYPNMTTSVLEQPGVVDYALENGYHLDSKGEDIINFIKGDIMVSDLPAVDLFSMAHICMLLSDDQLRELFGKIHKTLIKDRHPGDGALMICEALLNEDKVGPLMTSQRDIAGLVCATGGERSFHEYKALLEDAGFTNIKYHMFSDHICFDVILASVS